MPTSTISIVSLPARQSQFNMASLCGTSTALRQLTRSGVRHRTRSSFTGCLCWAVGLLLAISQLAHAQVSGTVFRDFNADGLMTLNVPVASAVTNPATTPSRGTVAEPGVSGVSVVATRTNGASFTAVTSATGGYTFPVGSLPAGERVRLEFRLTGSTVFSGPYGTASGTSVQFVTAGSTAVNFGVNAPADYCQANPPQVTTCFDDRTTGLASLASLVRFTTDQVKLVTPAAVKSANGFDKAGLMTETIVEDQATVGSVLGLAYHRQARKLFSAAFVKVHTNRGVGAYPNGIGAIYITDVSGATPITTLFATIPAVGTLTGAGGAAAQADVSRKGLGDLEISPAQDALYAINITAKTLIRIPLVINGSTITAGAPVSIPMTAPTDCGSNAYPFGIQFNNDKLYVTWTCDGAGTGVPLKGYVYEFDGTSTFTQKLGVDFRYGRAAENANTNNEDNDHNFTDWNTYGDPLVTVTGQSVSEQDRARARYTRSQPWLTDLAFDKGDMILGVRSRLGDVYNRLFFVKGGDLLRADANDPDSPTAWTLESDGTSGGITVTVPTTDPNTGLSGAATRSLGPGTSYPPAVDLSTLTNNPGSNAGTFSYPTKRKEFYWNDDGWEGESTNGGVLQIPGYPNVYVTQDDWLGHGGQHGVLAMNNMTGTGSFAGNVFYGFTDDQAFVVAPNNIAKSNGLGDLIALCNPAPIEIGNRIWKDDNRNGIQDPTETGLSGVVVRLFKNNVQLAQATTGLNGEYYFSSNTGTNSASTVYSLTGLTPGSNVELRIDQSQSTLTSYLLSPANQGSNDAIDSNFSPNAGTATAALTLGGAGQNNHAFDAGVFAFTCPTITFTAPANNLTFCGNSTTTFTVTSDAVAPNSIRFVAFNGPLASAADAYTATGGTVLGTVASTSATGTKTVSLTGAQLPDNTRTTSSTITVYALLVSADGACQPIAQRTIVLTPAPTVTVSGNTILCQGTSATLTAGGPAGTTFQFFPNTGTTALSSAATYVTPALSTTTTYRVRGTLNGRVSPDAFITVNPVPCTPCAASPTTVGGTAFRDFNSNGVNDGEPTLSNVTVTIFRCDANNASTQVATMQTDLNGSYSFTGLTAGTTYRVEFSNLPGGTQPTFRGAQNGTTVQFTQPGSCSISLGVNQPNDFCQANPPVAIPCYENGLRTGNNNPAVVAFPYDASATTGPKTTNATIAQVGALWGTDYQPLQKRLFAGALLKRHVDLGAPGVGGIFVLNYTASASTPAITNFNLQGITPATGPAIDLGSVSRTASTAGLAASNFQLSASSSTPNIDLDAYTKIGRVGLGDVDLDQTGNTLWTVNLNQRSLISVDVSGNTLPGTINHYPLEGLPGYPTPATYTNTGNTTLRINAGSATGFTDANGNTWVADQYATGGSSFTSANTLSNLGNPYESTNASQSLYQSDRYGPDFSYAVPVTNGRYRVVLHIVDFNSTAANQKVFDITAEGLTALDNLDLFTFRAALANRATTAQFVLDVTDGTLNLGFTASAGSAAVSGIEIIPIPSGASGLMRPWGLAFRNGKGYLGVVSDGSNSLRRDDLQAYVLEFNPANVAAGFTTTLDFPLNYNRENTNATNQPGHWTAWRSEITMQGDVRDPSYRRMAPQPILSDIDFTENGSMVLGFLDRTGNQEGFANNAPFAGTTLLNGSGPRTAGDIVQACFVNGTYVLEQGNNGGVCKSNDTGGTNQLTNDGPSNAGEFYHDDFFEGNGGNHLEVATGGLVQRKGSNEILSTVYDPTTRGDLANRGLFSQGVHWYNDRTGAKTDDFVVVEFTGSLGTSPYDPTTFGKAVGLGDPTLRCDAAPIQIGNRVWRDDNQNGIQDPCEPAIPGAVVSLYNAAKTTPIASATTNAAGEYYFSSTTLTAGTSTSSVATTALTYNTSYGLVITSLGNSAVVTSQNLILTDVSPLTPGETGAGNSGTTINNNDAKIDVVGGTSLPCIKLTTGGPGSSNHTYDFGIAKVICSLTATASASSQSICAGQPVTLTAQSTPVGSYTYAWSGPSGVTIMPTNAATVTASNLPTGVSTFTVTVTSSPSCLTTATVSVTVVAPPVVALTSAAVCAGQPVSLTASGAATYVFSTSGAVGNVLTVTPAVTTTYSVTGTTSGGCSATATGTVTVNPTPNAGPDQLLVCGPLGQTPNSTGLMGSPAGGLWSNASGNPTLAIFTPNTGTTTVSNLVAGTYNFNYTVNGCTDAVVVTVPICQTFCAEITATAQASSSTLTPGQSVTLTAQVTPAGSYTYAWSGPGTITPTNTSAVTASGLPNGVSTFTVTVTSSPGCQTTATVSVTVLTPALLVSVGTPVCNTLTNNYTASGTVSLTNAQAGNLTITDNGSPVATIAVMTGQTSATFSATGVSGSSPASHSVVATLGTATASTTYATPASCTVCSLSLTTSSLPNGQVNTAYSQTLTTTGGTAPLSFALTGTLANGLILNPATGEISGTPASATTAIFGVVVTDSKSCTALALLTITVGNAPVCSLTATATPGTCNTATNQYSITGTISATNTPANQSLTVSVGSISTLVALNGNGPVSYTLTGLPSDGMVRTVSVVSSASVCGMASTTYTAPASCTIAIALSVTPGTCSTATNQYSIAGTLSLTNATAGTATITDGSNSTMVTVNAGDTSVPYSLTGLESGSGNHIVTVSYAGKIASVTYTAPASCTVAPMLALTITPGVCNTVNNAYPLAGTVSFTAAIASTLTISDGTSSTVVSVSAGQTSLAFSLTLPSGMGTRIVTVTGDGYAPVSATYTSPESCTVAPVLALMVTPGTCNTATNQYELTGTVSITAAVASMLTISDGSSSTTVSITAGQTSATFSLSALASGSGSHTVTVSGTGYSPASTTYTAPVSCSLAPACTITATATPGFCATAANTYSLTAIVTIQNPPAGGTLTVSTGGQTKTFSTTVNGQNTFTAQFDGLVSDGASHMLVSSLPGCSSASTVYTAPISCSVLPPATASLGDYVFADNNQDGVQDTNDTPISGVTVVLLDGNNTPIQSTTTNVSGLYSFTGLTPGLPYSVSFVTPAGYTSTSAQVGGDDTKDSDANPVTGQTRSVTLAPGENNPNLDAGFFLPAQPVGSLGDFVWKDNNNNGLFDTNEPPVPGVQVELFTVSGGVTSTSAAQTTVTDGTGKYTFANLPSGDYRVKFTVPASLTDACQLTTKPNAGDDTRDSDADPNTGLTQIVTINASGTGIAKDNPTVDAGLQRRIYDPVGYIYCYKDGTILKGGTISVTGPGSISITEDGSKGYYQFFTDGTPGSYTLSYNNPSAFGIATGVLPPAGAFIAPTGTDGTAIDKDGILNGWTSLGSDVKTDTTALIDPSAAANPYYLVFNVVPGDPYVSENNLPIECTPPLGSIGSRVFNDANQNGQQDPSEPGVNNVTVRLLEQTTPGNFTLVSTTATAGNGDYLFPNLPAGTYVVEFVKATLPPGFVFTTNNAPGVPSDMNSDADPNTGRSLPITLVPTNPAQRNALAIDAGIVNAGCPPAKCVPLVIKQIRGPRR